MDSSSPSSQLHRPHPLAHLRSGNSGNSDNSRKSSSVVSENKNVQAAFDQLTKRQTLDTPSFNSNDASSSYFERSSLGGGGSQSSNSNGGETSGSSTSFTQRRLERGGAVPSSFTSFDWENNNRPHSSSVSSSEFDSSAYYGLSPFVTSSFMETTPMLERGTSIGNNTVRYRSLWQRYEKERRDHGGDGGNSSSGSARKKHHESEDELEEEDEDDDDEDDEERGGGSSSPEMLMKMSPHQVPEASSPKLLQRQQEQQQQRQQQHDQNRRRRRQDDNSDIELSEDEKEEESEDEEEKAQEEERDKEKHEDEHVFDIHDPASYNSICPQRDEPPPIRPSFDRIKNMLTSYAPSLPSSEDQAEYPLEHHHHQQQQHHAATTGQHQCSPAGTAKPRLERPPPRSHILQTPVFQVVNANTVKDRYLFLFNDLLIICKPIMDENIIVGDHHSAKEARYRFRPNENSLFQVKNIVELSKLTLYLSRDDQQKPSVSLAAAPRKMHPLLASALRKFETNPDAAIAYLVDKSVLANEPLSIANFLFKTPDLCRHQLGDFLADPKNSDIYDAFLDCFRMVALRLDEALRILLMTLRLPSKWEALEYVIERFSKKWHDANQNVVKFHEDMVVKVVVAMLFLNAEWWYDASSELDVFWSAREHKERRDRQRLTRRASMVDRNKDERGSVAIEPLHYISALRAQKGNVRPTFDEFLQRWRYYDQYILVSFDFLRDMYNSIAHERLETGWDNDVEASDAPEQDTIITVTPYRFPTRLTRSVPSAPITISIAAPDPGLQIKLRGQDIECHPNVLDFSDSCIQTFTITGHTLGRTSLMFIKSGPHASRYVSPTLPRTKSIVVERPFMRYTFQIAFSHVDMRLPPTAAAAAANAVTTPTTATAAAGSNTTPGTTEAPSGAVTGKDDDKTIAAAAGTTDEQEPKSPVMVRRKYIFSVETEQERTEWISWLKTLSGHVHVNGATATTNNNNNNNNNSKEAAAGETPMTSEERVGLQVLKEILLADEYKKGTANVAALVKPNTAALWGGNGNSSNNNNNNNNNHHHNSRLSMIDVASTHTALTAGSIHSPSANNKDIKDGDLLWVQSPGNDKDDVVVFGAAADEEQDKKNNRTSTVVSKKKPTVVTKRGHEIIKLVVQNSLVPLMLGFLRKQIQ